MVGAGAGYVQAKQQLEGHEGVSRALTSDEKQWLSEHIRILTF
jgi:hypothetical protein